MPAIFDRIESGDEFLRDWLTDLHRDDRREREARRIALADRHADAPPLGERPPRDPDEPERRAQSATRDAMAERMGASRVQLDADSRDVQLATLTQAARMMGKKLRIEVVDVG